MREPAAELFVNGLDFAQKGIPFGVVDNLFTAFADPIGQSFGQEVASLL